jgi:hypothetical protein
MAIGVNLTWNFVFLGTLVFEREREQLKHSGFPLKK